MPLRTSSRLPILCIAVLLLAATLGQPTAAQTDDDSQTSQTEQTTTERQSDDSTRTEDESSTDSEASEVTEYPPADEDSKKVTDDESDSDGEATNSDSQSKSPSPAEKQGEEEEKKNDADQSSEDVKARFHAYTPSIRNLIQHCRDSLIGQISTRIDEVIEESREFEEDQIESEQLAKVLDAMESWPDTGATIALFTPDVTGRMRWAIELELPIGQVQELIADLQSSEETADFFEGLEVSTADGRFSYRVGDRVVAILQALDTNRCYVRSHETVGLPTKVFKGTKGDDELVLAARLEMKSTEKDSGSSFFSNFRAVTSIDYTARIDDDKIWHDQLRVGWPIVSGLALKALVGTPKQTFFVPDDAFLGAVVSIPPAKSALDAAMGLEESEGPIASHVGDEFLVTVLPGSGFLPVPDIVAQCRTTKAEKLLDSLADETESANRKLVKEEKQPEWHESTVQGHRVFWSDRRNAGDGNVLPFVMRPVVFVQTAEDGKGRERDFLVAAWTSTNPERFVRRWLRQPREENLRFLPKSRSRNLEAWIHWQQVYDWVHPYINVSMPTSGAVLTKDIGNDIPEATIDGQLKLGGMIVDHQGPIPLGVLAVPGLIAGGLGETKNSDLARERTARRQLEVLYHHSKLFHQDTGRWPVRVAELDGYIDFDSNRNLLKLEESSQKRFGKLFARLFGGDEDDDDDDEQEDTDDEDDEEYYADIDDSAYLVTWQGNKWHLGIAENQLEHLDSLCIDEDGAFQRVEKTIEDDEEEEKDE